MRPGPLEAGEEFNDIHGKISCAALYSRLGGCISLEKSWELVGRIGKVIYLLFVSLAHYSSWIEPVYRPEEVYYKRILYIQSKPSA
jgi:hypothetical protein